MATLRDVARNAACDATVGLTNGGTIEFRTAADEVVATLTLSDPAFGAAVGGTADANAITADENAAGGDIETAVFLASDASEVFEVTVSATGDGGSIELSSTSIGAGDTVTLTEYSHTQPE